ncbi:MAG TPA: hypothetical protein VGI03_15035 [Verrucomicrobiae bacterium]|jgi:asparagine synthase (glutamine-hydrolysing)
MPGIAVIISREPAEKCRARLDAMLSSMSHESFYASASHDAPGLGIYAGAITFENSTDGVFHDRDQDIALIFSGECFVGSEIATGPKLVELYQRDGEKFVEKLNGLFSGLLIDSHRGRAILFNDRYGIQRVYFHESKGEIYVASEAKALLRVLPELRQFNPEGVADYLTFGCTLDWKTLFREIQILPGGSAWKFENGACRKTAYFAPQTWESQPRLTAEAFEHRFQETFKRILPRYFESTSRIGIALTGGLDTRMIMACRPVKNRTTCYTFSGNNGRTYDDKIAARVATASGLDHQLLRLGPDFFSGFLSHADKTVFVTDGCAGIFNSHEIYFNRQARELAVTRLTGNYGSEILRSVSTLKPVPLTRRLFNPELRATVESRTRDLSAHKEQPLTFAAFKEIPWNLFGNLAAGRSQVHFRTPYLDNELVALAFQAPEQIRTSSLPSFRLVRDNSPSLSEIPTDRGYAGDNTGLGFWSRRFFAEATFKLDYYHNEGMPNSFAPFDPAIKQIGSCLGVLGRHKFLHYRSWFRNELASYITDRLTGLQSRQNDFWDDSFVKTMAADHISGRKNYSSEINTVLTLESIERQLFHELPRN